MKKAEKQKLGLLVGFVGFLWTALTIIVPLFTPKPGVDPEVLTGAQKFVNFWTDNQVFFKDNGMAILIGLGLLVFGYNVWLKKK